MLVRAAFLGDSVWFRPVPCYLCRSGFIPRHAAPNCRPFASFARDTRHWPEKVTLRLPVSVKLRERDGSELGDATLARGLVMDLIKVNPDGTLEVRRGSIICRVDHAATNFLESWRVR